MPHLVAGWGLKETLRIEPSANSGYPGHLYVRSESCLPAQECVRCHSCLFSINQLNFYFQPPSHWAGGKHNLGHIFWKPSSHHTPGCCHSQALGCETPGNRGSCSVFCIGFTHPQMMTPELVTNWNEMGRQKRCTAHQNRNAHIHLSI